MKTKILFSAFILTLSQFSYSEEQTSTPPQTSQDHEINITSKTLDDALSGFGLALYYQEQQLAEKSLLVSTNKIEAYMKQQEASFHQYISSTFKERLIKQQSHPLTHVHTTQF